MTKFTKEEIEAEHRRRKAKKHPQRDVRDADEHCIHCGRPFSVAMSSAGAHGLCDDCLYRD